MGRSTGEGQERQSSTETRGALSPGLAAALADPEVAREAALYAATLPGPTGQTSERLASDRRVSAVVVAVHNALRTCVAGQPGLTGEEVLVGLGQCVTGLAEVLRQDNRTPMQP